MRPLSSVVAIAATAAILLSTLTLGSVAHAFEFSVVGPNTATVMPGEQVTIDLILRNPAELTLSGMGASIHGYDESVADFNSGQAVQSFLNDVCIAPGVCFGGKGNLVGPALAESEIGSNGPRVQFILCACLNAVSNNGDIDQGLDGVQGTPQFSFLFDAIAPGSTTLLIGTSYQGDGVILPDGSNIQATGTTFTINVVPEPGTAVLLGLGLLTLAASRRTR